MWLHFTVHTVTAWRADADTQTLIEKKIRDKSAFTGVRITLKPGQHQGTLQPAYINLLRVFSHWTIYFGHHTTQHNTTFSTTTLPYFVAPGHQVSPPTISLSLSLSQLITAFGVDPSVHVLQLSNITIRYTCRLHNIYS